MKSKDRIIIQKIIGYIDDIQKYINNLQAKDFLDDKLWGTITESLPDLKDNLKDIILNETNNIF